MLPDIEILKKIVRDTAQEEILPRFNSVAYKVKGDGSIVTEADMAADKRIRTSLAAVYPDIAFLSEEMDLKTQEELLASSPQLWCLDPLDGTSNFAAGLPLFATSLALIVNGEVQIGISYDAVRDEMFSAVNGQGATLNNEPLISESSEISLDNSMAIFDFKRLEPELVMRLLNDTPYRSHRNIGASVLELAWMAAGRGQVYLHGGMKLWDLAAGSLILKEAGAYCCTLKGEDIFKATMTPRSAIIASDKQLFQQWKSYLLDENKHEI